MHPRICFLCNVATNTSPRENRDEETVRLCRKCEQTKGWSHQCRRQADKMRELNELLALDDSDPMKASSLREILAGVSQMREEWLLIVKAREGVWRKAIEPYYQKFRDRAERESKVDIVFRRVVDEYGQAQVLKSVPTSQKFRMTALTGRWQVDDGRKKGASMHLSSDKSVPLHKD